MTSAMKIRPKITITSTFPLKLKIYYCSVTGDCYTVNLCFTVTQVTVSTVIIP